MRAAILALTQAGAQTARRAQLTLPGADIYLLKRVAVQKEWKTREQVHPFCRIRQAAAAVFPRYDALVFVMAAGIVVRSIAPLIRDKLSDPAVVVLDEQAHHVISLLSGHVGGANALTRQLAAALGADPVITTATDIEGIVAPDAITLQLGLHPEPHDAILTVNRALLDGAHVRYILDMTPLRTWYRQQLEALGCEVWRYDDPQLRAERVAHPSAIEVVITLAPSRFPAHQQHGGLFLRPMRLIAGIGCRKGTTADEILAALDDATARIGATRRAISGLASTVAKRAEAGLLDARDDLGVHLRFFENEPLAQTIAHYGLRESPFVKKTIGVGNVAEAAALAEAGPHARIALGKTKYEKVTVALVWQP